MKTLTLGIDISHWQTNSAENPQHFFDPGVAVDKGVDFAFLRATNGLTVDTAFSTFAKSFAAAGIPYGCYHYALPSGSTYGTVYQQVDKFWSTIEDTDFILPPVLDLESNIVDANGNMTGLSYTKAWLVRIEELSGMTPIIYTSPGFWTGLRDSGNAVWAAEYPLWLANYFSSLKYPQYDIPDAVANSTTLPTLPDPWAKKGKDWAFWQFCATGDGEFYGGDYAKHSDEVGLDLDVYNGSLEEMYEYFGIGQLAENDPAEDPIEEPEVPIGVTQYIRVIAKQANGLPGWLMFRDSPDFDYAEILAVGYGNTLELIEPEPINGLWHVKTPRGREGYVSAGSAYTELV